MTDLGELPVAERIFGVLTQNVLHWVALYRAALKAPEALDRVVLCVRVMQDRDVPFYCEWCERQNASFGSMPPLEWFAAHRLRVLAELLRVRSEFETSGSSEASSILGVGPMVGLPVPVNPELPPSRRRLIQLLSWAVPEERWNDEFDFRPFLARWWPVRYSLNQISHLGAAFELYDFLKVQLFHWVEIYRAGMAAACERPGVLEAVRECVYARVNVESWEKYRSWFAIAESRPFDQFRPQEWFKREKLAALEHFLCVPAGWKEVA